ncbi:MAG: hypothetical protein JEY91_05570 [Spirochaetaceae bacterium]|nr:hypothetical protein [Spirochaetaceae bacterium]
MNRKRQLIILSLISCLSLLYSNDIQKISQDYVQIVNLWINAEDSYGITLQKVADIDRTLDQLPDSLDKFYWKSRTALLRGQIWFFQEEKKKSIRELEKSQELAKISLDYENYSEGWRLISDAGSFIMLQKGVGYIISHSSDVQKQAEKALELDSTNARAALIVAQGLMNAPRLFGGNKEKGIEMLIDLSRSDNLSDEDRYFILSALGDAFVAIGRTDDAIRNYRMMLSLYPGSTFIQGKLENLQ